MHTDTQAIIEHVNAARSMQEFVSIHPLDLPEARGLCTGLPNGRALGTLNVWT